MGLRSRGMIDDVRQLRLALPIRVAWVHQAGEIVARTLVGTLRAVRTPWRWWDGFLDSVAVAAGFTAREVLAKLEAVARLRAGELGEAGPLPCPSG